MPRNVFLQELRERRTGLLGWAAGLVLLDLLMVAVWPTVRDASEEYQQILEAYPPEIMAFFGESLEFGTAAGFLDTELFSFMIPLLWLVFLIGYGASAVAGEQERGTLDLVLAHPVSRTRFLGHKAAAGALILTGFAGLSTLALWLGEPLAGLDPGVANLAAANVFAVLLCSIYGALALAVGAATGRRAWAIGIASGAAVATWLLAALARVVDWLEPLRFLSPFYYYSRHPPIVQGADAVDALVLAAPTTALLVVAWWTFRRRSLA